MTIKNLFSFDAIVCLLFGLSYIFIPKDLAKLFLTDPALTDGAIATFRSYGILLCAGAIALLFARNSIPSTARKGLLIFIVIAASLTLVNLIYTVLAGIANNKLWFCIIPIIIITIWGIVLLPKEKINT